MKLSRVVALLAGLFFVALGVWAFFGPHSFYVRLAHFPPYNRHFLHDVGAFQIGLGAALLIALRWNDAVGVALAGVGIGAAVHAASHWWDRSLGGKSSDPYVLTALALVLIVAAGLRHRGRSTG